jgi:hypothetical protein
MRLRALADSLKPKNNCHSSLLDIAKKTGTKTGPRCGLVL